MTHILITGASGRLGGAAVRSLLAHEDDWTPDTLGEFVGRAMHRAFRDA